MTTYLLDANVLIAITVAEHEHHERCALWASNVKTFAICPISEGALLRYLLRVGESLASARALLATVRALPSVEFWPDSLSYADLELKHVRGHRQVTDAYLVALVRDRPGALLATLDHGLASDCPGATFLVPQL